MKELLNKLKELITDYSKPDYERYYILKVPKNVILEYRNIFMEDFKNSETNIDFKKIGVDSIEDCTITKMYIPSIGFIELQETKGKEISIELN